MGERNPLCASCAWRLPFPVSDDGPKLTPAPPGWDQWKRRYAIEAELGLVRSDLELLIRHLRERPPNEAQPACCAYTCLGYAVGGLIFMFTAPFLLERGSWAGDFFDSVGIRNWGYLALAGLVAVGVHAFRPRPGPVETPRLVALQTLLELLERSPLAEGARRDARWELHLELSPLDSHLTKDEWEHSTARHERTKTYELTWLELRARASGRSLRLELKSERADRDVHHEKTKSDGRVKFSTSEKEPRFRHVLRGKLEADELRPSAARRALAARPSSAELKDELEESEGCLRVAWIARGEPLDGAVHHLAKLAKALAAGAG